MDNHILGDVPDYIIQPDVDDPRYTSAIEGYDEKGNAIALDAIEERALAVYLNSKEIVTLMTVGDYPETLAVGYLVNQNMLVEDDVITAIEYDEQKSRVRVRTEEETDYEYKLKRKVLTSGCGQGTIFGDIMEKIDEQVLPDDLGVFAASQLEPLLKKVKNTPSLYRKAGSIHGCVLCKDGEPVLYTEDVGRHNAMDKIAGWLYMNNQNGGDFSLYTTGRMTSEMVIKTISMGIPILISRSGATHWGVRLARQAGLTLMSRARGKRFIALSGVQRIRFDLDSPAVAAE